MSWYLSYDFKGKIEVLLKHADMVSPGDGKIGRSYNIWVSERGITEIKPI